MILREYHELPRIMQNNPVKNLYKDVTKLKLYMVVKRVFDIIAGFVLIAIFSPILLLIACLIKIDSKGPIIFKQERVTQYCQKFQIYKFRTMRVDMTDLNKLITTKDDLRVTKIGKILRKYKLDELPQLYNVLMGDMSFVGVRPEVVKYVDKYSEEMYVTLLFPAGITSYASLHYKDEAGKLDSTKDIDYQYINDILPEKMRYNIKSTKNFSLLQDLKIMLLTVIIVLGIRKISR
ncbi:glycosyl transferase [Candidatus Izimaplasma bacterium ZiA1]|uniref:sugar transferase n=1 Tax=Candidatus Izimoplasma sp. ZiA1 TaxID=2024899 RepID=UPI000BAA8D6C|nr:glycosyl transferase [Candidatus Izimaplasma bacterium ZiA1]